MADVLAVRDAYRAQQWEMVVQECAASGLSNREFCRQRGIAEKSFYYWQRKLRRQIVESASPQLVPLEPPAVSEEQLCIQYRGAELKLTGMKFGKLTVLEKDSSSPGPNTKWICQCDCSNIVSVLSESLRTGKSTSCGCNRRKLRYDLTGHEFGYLLVLGMATKSRYQSNEIRWKCKCQNCGRIVDVSSRVLREGNPYGHCRCTRLKKNK